MKWLIAFSILVAVNTVQAKVLKTVESEGMKIMVEELVSGRDVIWGMDFIDSENLIFTEREGKIQILNLKTGQLQNVEGAPKVLNKGQGGLLDIFLHPDFKKNSRVYISYSIEKDGKYTTALAMAELKNNKLENFKNFFVADPGTENAQHFGSRFVLKDKFLYVCIGEGNERELAQKLSTHRGKVLRFSEDGTVPKDNPFVGVKDAKPEIWSYGLRNPQGMILHPSGEVWEAEHGPRGGDEVNVIKKGANYGWPVITYGKEYFGIKTKIGEGMQKEGMEQPIYKYVPSIAPSGMAYYTGSVFSKWRDSLFQGSLVLTHLNRLQMNGTKVVKEERLFEKEGWRIRSVKQGPEGFVYFGTDDGRIIRLRP